MNIMNKVTLQSMKKNKTRTIVTIVGIILSVSMVTAVTTIVTSLQNYLYETAVYENGSWHGMFQNISFEKGEEIAQDDGVADTVYTQYIGYAKMEASKNDFKPYLYVIGGNDETFDTLPIHLTEGRLPKNDAEIILPNHLENNGGVSYKLNDVLLLPLGDRMSDGYKLFQNNPITGEYDDKGNIIVSDDETLETNTLKQYTIVGFYERPSFENFTAPGYTAITFSDLSDKSALYDVYYTMKNPQDVMGFSDNYYFKDGLGGSTNNEVLMYQGVSQYDTYNSSLYGMIAILIVIIMMGSIALIYNAFSISVSERTVQFGLLSSIGATKKQIRKSVRFEALVLGLIGIPIGILAGIGGIGVTFFLLGDNLKTFTTSVAGGDSVQFHMSVSWIGIAAAVVIACITLAVSVIKPAFRASRITAIEAIRSSKDISDRKADRKNHKTSKITYKIFGLPGVLAKKYYTRSAKKYRATIISLFMSIVLFVSASSFILYLTSSVNNVYYRADYDITATISSDYADSKAEVLQEVRNLGSVDKASSSVMSNFLVENGEELLTNEGKAALMEKYGFDSFEDLSVDMFLVGFDDETYENYVTSLGLNPEDLGENDVILYGLGQTIDYKNGTVKSYDFLKDTVKTVEFSRRTYNVDTDTYEKGEEYSFNVATTAESMPFGYNGRDSVSSNVVYGVVRENSDIFKDTEGTVIFIDSNDYEKTEKELGEISEIASVYNAAAEIENSRALMMVINVFAYGFIVLISLISVTNVFNTIVTNLKLRQRDFAMLRSVGMTKGSFRRMMIFECLIYGTKALLFGIPVSFLITLWIYSSVNVTWDGGLLIPWSAYGIVIVSVFIVVLISMVYAMSKINRNNLVETLRKDSI
ncbi:MAG: ABC transporter permease [Anaeromassilibacillus sp.]|nr:ABC transporter permease [Anaeromassilibacillus sp.]MDY3778661.1 FtsX-like permease family protein [Candidatus Limousia pullorum]